MRNNKTIALLLVVCLLAQCLVGCGHKERPKEKDTYIPEETITEEVVGQTKITEDTWPPGPEQSPVRSQITDSC